MWSGSGLARLGQMTRVHLQSDLLRLVRQDSVPALGCTEPVAVAYAAAYARQYFGGEVGQVTLTVSDNIFKNGKSVLIPGAAEAGLALAAALGLHAGDATRGLLVLEGLSAEQVAQAKTLLPKVTLRHQAGPDVYVHLDIQADKHVELELSGGHDRVAWVKVDGQVVYQAQTEAASAASCEFMKELSLAQLRELAEETPLAELVFVEQGIKLNQAAAQAGLEQNSGLGVGHKLLELERRGIIKPDASTKARLLTTAAADMRMGGGDCPIMTSGGSGNQGLGVILPMTVMAQEKGVAHERLLRAIYFAHAVNRYVKVYSGKLSGMCGCAIGAGVGAAAGMTWMLGGTDSQIAAACNILFANLTGMLCDGAKNSCSLKLGTSAGEAVLATYLALENVQVEANVGVIGKDIEETIHNIGRLAREGFKLTDQVMLDIIA